MRISRRRTPGTKIQVSDLIRLYKAALLASACFGILRTLLAQNPPQVLSVTPANGQTGIATNSPVVFVFDQDMDTRILPFNSLPPTLIGNFEFEPANVLFGGT